MPKSLLLIAAATLLASAAVAQEAPVVREITGEDELVAKKGALASTWVRADADIGRYDRLLLWEPEFQFREGGETSSGTTARMLQGDQGPFAIRQEDQEKFKQLVRDTFVAELERSKLFTVVDTVGPGTLIARAGFVDITSFVPPDATRFGDIHLAAVGEATIVVELIDAGTGVIQARAAERKLIQPEARMRGVNPAPANAATVWADVERWAREQAQDLRKALEKAKKKAE